MDPMNTRAKSDVKPENILILATIELVVLGIPEKYRADYQKIMGEVLTLDGKIDDLEWDEETYLKNKQEYGLWGKI